MRIIEVYSHLNAEDALSVHRPELYEQVKHVIREVDAEVCRTKVSEGMKGRRRYSPQALNGSFARRFEAQGWQSVRYQYYVTTEGKLLEQLLGLPLERQRRLVEEHGVEAPVSSCVQGDFVKDRVVVEVQFGELEAAAYDLFVKHLLLHTGGITDLGIEILPVEAMISDREGGTAASDSDAYFEGQVYNVLRYGRNIFPVPLVIMGVAP